MEIEVEEYVRTKSGIILKADIIDFKELTISQKGISYDFENIEEMKDFIKNNIINHSKNILDLIEVRRLCEWIFGCRYCRRFKYRRITFRNAKQLSYT